MLAAAVLSWQIVRKRALASEDIANGKTKDNKLAGTVFETQMLLANQESNCDQGTNAGEADEVIGPQFRFDPSQFKAL